MFKFSSSPFDQKEIYPNEQTKFVAERLLEDPKIKSVLNIGYRFDSDHTIRNLLIGNNKTFSILEAYKPNCEVMENQGISPEIIHMDVRDIDKLDKKYDAIIWLHGPEHIHWNEFIILRHKIESKANHLIIYQAPIGECPQEEIYNNPYEKHIATLRGDLFTDLGYKVINHDKNGEWTFSAFLEKL